MKIFKTEVNKIILALSLVGLLILLFFPASLSASHFRYGTMSWDLTGNDNATHREIKLSLKSGWNNNSSSFTTEFDEVNEQNYDFIEIIWGDGSTENVTMKTTSVNTTSQSTITEIGDNSSCNAKICTSGWINGVTHSYADNATYIISWGSTARIASIVNIPDSSKWRNQTKVTVGGTHIGNVSPVSAVPPIIQVQDNTTDNFTYQVSASDANSGDNLNYRWGTWQEFIDNGSSTYYPPTGMNLSPTGNIQWDVRDSVLVDNAEVNSSAVTNSGVADAMWLAFIMVEDNGSSADNKSYIPIDFFFKIASGSNDPPVFTEFPNGVQTVLIGNTATFTIKSHDSSTTAPTISADPCSGSTWTTTSSTAIVGSDNTTTFTITFTPNSSMGGTSCVVPIRSTDAAGMTKDKSFVIQVPTNYNPTAPILLSPANGDNVTSPVKFIFSGSTDSDDDNVTYTMYIGDSSNFDNCTVTSVIAGSNFVHPFNQNFNDNLMPWASQLHAATITQQISQDNTMLPKWLFMLAILGLLCGIISFSVKNITLRRIVFMLFLIIIGTTVSCSTSTSSDDSSTLTVVNVDNTTVFSVATADNLSLVSIYDNITVTFSKAMDPTYITTNTADSYCSGTIMVSKSSDNFSSGTCVKMSSAPASSNANKTFTLDPYDNLTRLTTYLTRVKAGVRDAAGNAIMSSLYETTSGFSTDNISTARFTVSNTGCSTTGPVYSDYISGKTYYWKIKASDPRGGSSYSGTWSFTVQ